MGQRCLVLTWEAPEVLVVGQRVRVVVCRAPEQPDRASRGLASWVVVLVVAALARSPRHWLEVTARSTPSVGLLQRTAAEAAVPRTAGESPQEEPEAVALLGVLELLELLALTVWVVVVVVHTPTMLAYPARAAAE